MRSTNSTEAGGPAPRDGSLRVAIGLLSNWQRVALISLTAARIVVGLCDLAVAAAMYLLFSLLQGRTPVHSFGWTPRTALSAALITSSLVVLRALMDLASARTVFKQIQNLYTDFILQLTQGYSQMRWSKFVECNRSELSNHALHTARESADFYYHCIEMTAAVIIVVAMSVALLYQSPIVACGLGVILAAFYGAHRLLVRERLHMAASSRESIFRALQRDLADMLSAGKEIRTYGNQNFFINRIFQQAKRLATNNLRIMFLPQVVRVISDQGVVLLFLCMIIAVQLHKGNVHQLLSLLAFYFVLSRRMLPLVGQLSFIAGQLESSYENVKVLDAELKRCRKYPTISSPVRLPQKDLALDVREIKFSFCEGTPILRNITFCLNKGETAILYGASGIGKSSLLNLIAGVSQPETGVIFVDRRSIAYVPQEITLLDDSIRSNLLFGLMGKSDEELMKALEIAMLDEFVAMQPSGLETLVGDNGALLSGGQRQRLGIARAILRGGQLILLDEATSALDELNERLILQKLSASGSTVLLVTHRAHTQAIAQRLFRLQGGLLIEEFSRQGGKYEQVISEATAN